MVSLKKDIQDTLEQSRLVDEKSEDFHAALSQRIRQLFHRVSLCNLKDYWDQRDLDDLFGKEPWNEPIKKVKNNVKSLDTLDVVGAIKDHYNLLGVVSEIVSLNRANYGLCPFHNEKTSSFHVDESKQLWHCFGCGAGGDLLSFVSKYYEISFQDTLKKLANEAGIPMKRRRLTQAERMKKMSKMLK